MSEIIRGKDCWISIQPKWRRVSDRHQFNETFDTGTVQPCKLGYDGEWISQVSRQREENSVSFAASQI